MSRGELRSPAPLGQSLSAWADGFFSEEVNRDCLVWAPYLRDLFDEYTHFRYCGSLRLRPFLRLLRGYCRTRGWHCLDADVEGPQGAVLRVDIHRGRPGTLGAGRDRTAEVRPGVHDEGILTFNSR